ncbi:MAG TPA: hypothetical protein VK846_12950 [Candidatus Limnocylindria bacterium]|nr:hypothetical protein [Candidatus Limnocylindria bacterium]
MLFAFAVCLSACSQIGIPAAKSPPQAVFEAKTAFLGAVRIANDYKSLPPCPTVTICSNPSVVVVIQKAAVATQAALNSADATVNDPQFKDGSVAQKAAVAAQNSFAAFVAITATLRTK